MTENLSVILILFLIASAVAAIQVKKLISAAFLLSIFSFFLTLLWVVLKAPDVSFTEAMVGAGASTIFFLLALFQSKLGTVESPSHHEGFALVVCVLLGAVFVWGSLDLPDFGSVLAPASQYLSPYYLKAAYQDSHTPNVVTAVVVDYRSFDTLIEATVVFTAGIACLFIMRTKL